MKLYNSLSQQVEPFDPPVDPVSIYVCGITPYDTTHLGHAFTYASIDLLIRYLEYSGHSVIYAQNVTDIDDDILRKAREEGEDWQVLGDRWTVHYLLDMQALNIRPPDFFPRATETIDEILQLVADLIEAGSAYESGGSVYYDIATKPDYGKLSRIPIDEMLPIANERGNFPDDPNKHHPLDFILWQAQAPGEPAWESPWGPGRPGWHIECSAMSSNILGPTIDVHSGGSDLIYPHHDSEIAQLEPLSGEAPVRFWMHCAMVHHEGEKMSKSLGNLVMIRDLLKHWSADALQLYIRSHHYRQVWSHSDEELQQANILAKKLQQAVQLAATPGERLDPQPFEAAFRTALDNDLDGPGAIESLSDLADQILLEAGQGNSVAAAQVALRTMGAVFGLRFETHDPLPEVALGWQKHIQKFSDGNQTGG